MEKSEHMYQLTSRWGFHSSKVYYCPWNIIIHRDLIQMTEYIFLQRGLTDEEYLRLTKKERIREIGAKRWLEFTGNVPRTSYCRHAMIALKGPHCMSCVKEEDYACHRPCSSILLELEFHQERDCRWEMLEVIDPWRITLMKGVAYSFHYVPWLSPLLSE